MPKKKKTSVETPKNSAVLNRIQRTEGYAEKVRREFANTVNAILALNKTLPKLDEGVMYSFDGDNARKQKQVEALLRRLHSVCTLAIQRGIQLEWKKATEECDKLAKSAFGKAVLSTPEYKAWNVRNKEAMTAFMERTDKGMNLSDRVWKSVRQLRDEMEVAMTVSIGEGQSASEMSRKVRQYLNDPDLMFRRFRYKDENGEWKLKWKKRVKDEKTGKIHFIDYDRDSYIPTGAGENSRGVYKSAAKNAMRVARTETNMAYRRADYQRWNDMDFVVGIRVQLSHSHPKKDICDKLQGDYPKTFVFEGWHPQCFCFATPITIPPEETLKLNKMMVNGEDWRSELRRMARGRMINDYPDDFKNWVISNKDKILSARDRGTEPYFIKNNASAIDEILNPKPITETIKNARIRQSQRTPEEIDDIKNRWAKHEHRLEVLRKADERHAARTPEQIQAIREAQQKWQEQKAHMRKTADNVLKAAGNYGEVDYTALEAYIAKGQFQKMYDEAKKVQKQIQEVIKDEKALSVIIPNAHDWHKQFTSEELHQVYDAVEKKIDFIEHKPLNTYKYKNELEQQNALLADEIKYVEDPTYLKTHTIHKTWKVAQDAYAKKQIEILYKIDVKAETDKLTKIKTWAAAHPKAAKIQSLLAEAEAAINANSDLAVIKDKVAIVENDYKHRVAAEKSRKKKKGISTSFNADDYTKEAKDKAIWCKSTSESMRKFQSEAEDAWNDASADERDAWHGYTAGSGHMNRPLRGYQGSWYDFRGVGKVDLDYEGGEKHIRDFYNLIERHTFPTNRWFQRGLDDDGLRGLLGIASLNEKGVQALVGTEITDWSFISCGSAKGTGFSGNILNIYCPKGTKGIYLAPHSVYKSENESILQAGTKFRITKVEYSGYRYYIDIEVVGYETHPSL